MGWATVRALLVIVLPILALQPIWAIGEKQESFEYKIQWNFITIGYSTYTIYTKVPFQDQRVWMFETTARAAPVIQAFFPVEDRIISFWDPSKKRSLWHEKSIREGNYHRTNRVHFNYEHNIAVWWQTQYSANVRDDGLFSIFPQKKEKNGIIENIGLQANDILSAIYLNRIAEEEPIPGSEYKFPIFDDNRFSNVSIQVLELGSLSLLLNGETVEVPCVVVVASLETSGMFRSKGRVKLWLSRNDNRIPLKMQTDIPPLGKVEAVLIKAHPHP